LKMFTLCLGFGSDSKAAAPLPGVKGKETNNNIPRSIPPVGVCRNK